MITGKIVTIKFIIDMIAKRQDVRPDTVVTITQDTIDGTERTLQTAREMTTDKFESISIGFTTEDKHEK